MKYMVGLKATDTKLLDCIRENKQSIYEVYFSWGDIPNGRSSQLLNEEYPHESDFQEVYAFFNKDVPLFTAGRMAAYHMSKYEVPQDVAELMHVPVNKKYQTGNVEVSATLVEILGKRMYLWEGKVFFGFC